MIYADSTFFIAAHVRRDTFHTVALPWYESRQDDTWLWSPWHRVEVFNSIRHLTRHPEAKRRLKRSEARGLIHELENDVRVGYYTHVEADWRDVLRTANELSLAHAFDLPFRAADLLHVAYAKELAAITFVGFDDNQLALAHAAGLTTIKPS